MPFVLVQNKKAFENLSSLFSNLSNYFSYATLTGGNITSAKKDTETSTVKLEIKCVYYDTSSYPDPVWGDRYFSSQDPWFMDKQFEIYRNDKKNCNG